MSPDVLAALKADGAVGDMAGQIFTLSGETHPSQYNRRIIGITLDDLCNIPLVIAVAAGQDKAEAILGALRTSAIKVLCTDDQAAREILRLSGVH
jgi:DNA-binding transcriptional regulator LsrR (DeoR family)